MNKDWNNLKKSASGIPTWDSFIPYVLEVIKNGEETTRGVIVKCILEYLDIPEEMRGIEYDNSEKSQSILYNRIGFALADLYKAKAIIRPKRAVYRITDDGLSLLNEYGDQLTTDILQEQTEYVAYMKELELRNIKSDEDDEEMKFAPLLRLVMKELGLSANNQNKENEAGKISAEILGNLGAIPQNMAELRNLFGDGHGKSSTFVSLPPRYARLAVDTSVTIVYFIWETYQDKKTNF